MAEEKKYDTTEESEALQEAPAQETPETEEASAPEAAEASEQHPETEEVPELKAEEEEQKEETAEEPAENAAAPAVAGGGLADAQKRVVAARSRVESAEEEIEECIRNIQEDLAEFEAYEKGELLPVVEESQKLLESIGMEEAAIEPTLTELELEDPHEEKLRIEDLSSGKGGAFFWGLIAAVATVGGWYAFAVQKAGAPLIPQKVPDMGTLSALSGKVSLLFGPAENPSVGAAVVIGTALVVWWLVYTVLVAVRASYNKRIAEEIEEKAGFYCQKKKECKAMMERVREHLKTLQQTVRKYEVLLAEKNAALRRALFIEEAKDFDGLHAKSKELAREMEAMLKELDRLLATPMAKSGVLTKESEEALRQAKRVVNDMILRLYN
jgi:hypothetical protein